MSAGVKAPKKKTTAAREEGGHVASAAAEPSLSSALLRSVEQLAGAAGELSALLTEATERHVCLRGPLDTALDALRVCRHCVRRRQPPCAVPRRSGRSELRNFILWQCSDAAVMAAAPHTASASHVTIPSALNSNNSNNNNNNNNNNNSNSGGGKGGKNENDNNDGGDGVVTRGSARMRKSLQHMCSSIRSGGDHSMSQLTEYGPGAAEPACRTQTSTRCAEAGGGGVMLPSISTASKNIYKDHGSSNKQETSDAPHDDDDDGVCQDTAAQLLPLNDRSCRRYYGGNDAMKKRMTFRFVRLLSFPDHHLKPAQEQDQQQTPQCMEKAEAPPPSVTIPSGKFERTIVDYIQSKSTDGVINSPQEGQKGEDACCSAKWASDRTRKNISSSPGGAEMIPPATCGDLTGANALCSPSNMCRPPLLWLLQESADIITRCNPENIPSCQAPDSLNADAIFFTVPCDLVGSHHRLKAVMYELFAPFVSSSGNNNNNNDNNNKDASCGKATSHPNKRRISKRKVPVGPDPTDSNDTQNMCQLVSDMTFYVLTFSDAILSRSEGVHSLDEQLADRPPPMATTLRELITLFQRDMLLLFNVHVDCWQVIPFSSPMSEVTRNVLSEIYAARLARKEASGADEGAFSFPSTVVPLFLGNFSMTCLTTTAPPPPPTAAAEGGVGGCTEPNLQLAIHEYCDVMYGQRFRQHRDKFPSEQLEKLVWRHALTNMWSESGARQLLHTVRCFEWNSLRHIVANIAFSLVLWCKQLQSVLPRVRRFFRWKYKSLQGKMIRAKRDGEKAISALQQLKDDTIPRQMSQPIQWSICGRFKDFTVRFWWTLLNLLEGVNEMYGISHPGTRRVLMSSYRPLLLASSKMSMQAKEKLYRQYHEFLNVYVTQRYQVQMAQLQSIIEERKQPLGGPAAFLHTEEEIHNNEGEDMVGGLISVFSSTLTPSVVSPIEAPRHHLPFVEEHAQDLKIIMQKELSLQLARLNTEVINYFMAGLSDLLPELVKTCDEQRKGAKKKLLRLVTRVDSRGTYDVAERRLLRFMLSEISRFPLLGMQPREELEAFLVGMRSALCQDQLLLYVRQLGQSCGEQEGECTPNTTAYLLKTRHEREERQRRVAEQIRSQNDAWFVHPLDEYDDNFWAPMDVEEELGGMPPQSRARKSTHVGFRDAPHFVRGEGTAAMDRSASNEAPPESGKSLNACSDTLVTRAHPMWFFLAVWQDVMSAMPFRPWLLLNNLRYASLLNGITRIFLKGQHRLESLAKDEGREVDVMLRNVDQEMQRLRVGLPLSLQQISNTAKSVAHEMKSCNAETIKNLSMSSVDVE